VLRRPLPGQRAPSAVDQNEAPPMEVYDPSAVRGTQPLEVQGPL